MFYVYVCKYNSKFRQPSISPKQISEVSDMTLGSACVFVEHFLTLVKCVDPK